MLGDSDVARIGESVRGALVATVKDLATPPGGWARLADDAARGARTHLAPGGHDGGGLGPAAMFTPALLAGSLVSFLKYPAAALVKAPAKAGPALAAIAALALVPVDDPAPPLAGVAGAVQLAEELAVSTALSVAIPLVLLSRVFFGAMLDERNAVLAANIRAACAERRDGAGEVIAVLGAAHVNGVRQLLLEDAGSAP